MYMYYLYPDTDAVLCLRGCKKDKAAVLIQYVYSYSTFAFTCLHAYPDVRPSTLVLSTRTRYYRYMYSYGCMYQRVME